jgi:predicted RNA methylase
MKTKKRRKEATPEQKAAAHAKRAELIALSKAVKAAMESGQMPDAETINAGIIEIYKARTGQPDFRGFGRWREEGYQVKKGEHGLAIWGQPRAARATEPEPAGDPADPERKFKLFPMAYVFHAGQVEPMDPSAPRRERAPRTEPTDPAPRPRPKAELADRLRTLADGMNKDIDAKMNPGIAQQNPTRRRHAIAESMREDGKRLQLAQIILRAAADCHDGSEAPEWISELDSPPAPSLLTVTSKAAAIEYARRYGENVRAAMARAGAAPSAPDWKARYRAALGDLIGAKYDGFFPTGDKLAERIAEMCEVGTRDSLQILEPSAGTGNLALAAAEIIRANSKIWTVERVPRLSATLNIIAEGNPAIRNAPPMDFLSLEDDTPEGFPSEYDRVIMNPPFEKGQDMMHVQAAYSLLKSGGVMVAIMCSNCWYREDGEYPAFREWLESIGAETERAPEDAFQGTIRTTKTAAVIVKIRKN